ncbi:MAG: hypothetical protein ACXVZ1_09225 [Gaiellaceae bacterium]
MWSRVDLPTITLFPNRWVVRRQRMLASRNRAVRRWLASGVVVLALVFSASAFSSSAASGGARALDHVSIKTHDIVLGKRVSKTLALLCKKHQKSTRRHPCRKNSVGASAPDGGWSFGLSLGQNSDGTWPLTVLLRRQEGSTLEQHFYSFTLAASSVTLASDLSSSTIDTGTQLGQFGSIKLKLGHVGALASMTPVAGCTNGTWQMRTGTMTGKVDFRADKTYFQTIVETSLPTDVSANTSAPATCTAPPLPCTHGSGLSASVGPGGPIIYANVEQLASGGSFSLLEFVQEKVAPATISHALNETNLPATDLAIAPDLSSGTATTSGASRFTGSLSFTASLAPTTGPYPACSGTYTVRQGVTTGGITGHFLAIPPPGPALGQSFASTR